MDHEFILKKSIHHIDRMINTIYAMIVIKAAVAELADARDSKSRDRKVMRVRFSPAAPTKKERGRSFFIRLWMSPHPPTHTVKKPNWQYRVPR